jgi:uncharacterized protein
MARNILMQLGEKVPVFLKGRGITPEKVVVFGSHAEKRASRKSDIDLMIVSRDFRGKSIFEKAELVRGFHMELVDSFHAPFDILYYSDAEWESAASPIIRDAKSHGVVVFG